MRPFSASVLRRRFNSSSDHPALRSLGDGHVEAANSSHWVLQAGRFFIEQFNAGIRQQFLIDLNGPAIRANIRSHPFRHREQPQVGLLGEPAKEGPVIPAARL
jgi:hypothetical protein